MTDDKRTSSVYLAKLAEQAERYEGEFLAALFVWGRVEMGRPSMVMDGWWCLARKGRRCSNEAIARSRWVYTYGTLLLA